MRRAHGSGSLFQHKGRWVFQRSFMEDGRRVHRGVTGATPEEALARAEARTDWTTPKAVQEARAAREREALRLSRAEIHLADHMTAFERKVRARRFAAEVIKIGLRENWTILRTAEVVIAQLTPSRVRRNIFGPCTYCGSWTATEVDHIIPTVRGGTDDPSNLASACQSCNARKRTRTPEEWAS